MDKQTLSHYGWIVVLILILSVLLALATPFGEFIAGAFKSTYVGFTNTIESAFEKGLGIDLNGDGEIGGSGGSGGTETPDAPDGTGGNENQPYDDTKLSAPFLQMNGTTLYISSPINPDDTTHYVIKIGDTLYSTVEKQGDTTTVDLSSEITEQLTEYIISVQGTSDGHTSSDFVSTYYIANPGSMLTNDKAGWMGNCWCLRDSRLMRMTYVGDSGTVYNLTFDKELDEDYSYFSYYISTYSDTDKVKVSNGTTSVWVEPTGTLYAYNGINPMLKSEGLVGNIVDSKSQFFKCDGSDEQTYMTVYLDDDIRNITDHLEFIDENGVRYKGILRPGTSYNKNGTNEYAFYCVTSTGKGTVVAVDVNGNILSGKTDTYPLTYGYPTSSVTLGYPAVVIRFETEDARDDFVGTFVLNNSTNLEPRLYNGFGGYDIRFYITDTSVINTGIAEGTLTYLDGNNEEQNMKIVYEIFNEPDADNGTTVARLKVVNVLGTPTIKVDYKTMTITPVANATSYDIYKDGNFILSTNNLEVDLSDYLSEGTCSLGVVAKGNSQISSSMAIINHKINNLLPEGSIYTVNRYGSSEHSAYTVLVGDGKTVQWPSYSYSDDTFEYQGVKYTYSYAIANSQYVDGWVVSTTDKSLTRYELMNSVNGYPIVSLENAFKNCNVCEDFSNIVVPSTVIDIDYAFNGCSAMTKAPDLSQMSASNPTFVYGTFAGCSSLVVAPELPTAPGWTGLVGTFSNCSSLVATPVIPETVMHLTSTFANCTSLTTITSLHSNIQSLEHTFESCTGLVNLSNVTIPTSVTTMSCAFYECSNLEYAPVITRDNLALTNMMGTFYECTSLKAGANGDPLRIPDNVQDVSYCFYNCQSFEGKIYWFCAPTTYEYCMKKSSITYSNSGNYFSMGGNCNATILTNIAKTNK